MLNFVTYIFTTQVYVKNKVNFKSLRYMKCFVKLMKQMIVWWHMEQRLFSFFPLNRIYFSCFMFSHFMVFFRFYKVWISFAFYMGPKIFSFKCNLNTIKRATSWVITNFWWASLDYRWLWKIHEVDTLTSFRLEHFWLLIHMVDSFCWFLESKCLWYLIVARGL